VGVGEKLSDIEVFHPDRIVSRILGMGDMLTLIEKAQEDVDEAEAEELGKRMQRAEFDFEDFRKQMRRIKKLGSLDGVMKLIPGMGKIKDKLGDMQVPDKEMARLEAIISSMTMQERRDPDVINPSRKKRIAAGSGTKVEDVNALVKNFEQMRKMMKKMMGKGGKMPQGMPGGMGGGLPGMGGVGGMAGMGGAAGMPGLEGPGRGGSKATKASRKKKKQRRNKKKRK
jgi:signal recognition particle subunit SRP54